MDLKWIINGIQDRKWALFRPKIDQNPSYFTTKKCKLSFQRKFHKINTFFVCLEYQNKPKSTKKGLPTVLSRGKQTTEFLSYNPKWTKEGANKEAHNGNQTSFDEKKSQIFQIKI